MARTAREPDKTLAIPDERDCGDAMRVLTPAQRAFVCATLESGGRNNTLAALRAGYGSSEDQAKVVACHMMRNPKIIAAIREEADRRLQSGALLASSALIEIAQDDRHKDRFKAAVELLNRAGLMVETRHRITVEDNRDTETLKAEVEKMLERVFKGERPAALAPPIDAEFQDVSTRQADVSEQSTHHDPDDLSDILAPT